MKFKDIVNRNLANLTNCEQEPIHIPGSIQPHGFLLGLRTQDLIIEFCSENAVVFTGLPHEVFLSKSFASIFGDDQALNLSKHVAQKDELSTTPLLIELDGKTFTCSVQKNDQIIILEFESAGEEEQAVTDIYQQAKQFTLYMQKASTLQMLCQSVAEETRRITGYDRVMVYRFDEEYNGEVFAESQIESIAPLLGLHYPHTDIPAQARQLYIKNLVRIIVDAAYKPVSIYTIDDAPDKNLDLGMSTLRSVSPIHIQYLKNMDVAATLTISLMHEDQLWGLIACHHASPKYVSPGTRIAARLQGLFLTSQINVRQLAEEYEVAKKVNYSLDELIAKLFATDDLTFADITDQPSLLNVTNAGSVILSIDNELYTKGATPHESEIRKLIHWLHSFDTVSGFNTHHLCRHYPDAEKWCESASGILFHSLGGGANNCIIWCRPQALQEVNWAGDPEKAVIKTATGLSPRHSFEIWKEIKKCESRKWQQPELIAAANFANALQKHVYLMFLTREETKQRKLTEKLREANAELENLNWIGSHDLKEPLRKIQIFASRILDQKDKSVPDLIINSVKKMNESARRMQLLIADILSYSRLSHLEKNAELVNLAETVKRVIAELNFEITEKGIRVECGDLPAVKGVAFMLHQLFTNLVSNSIKFSTEGRDNTIAITLESITNPEMLAIPDDREFYKIVVADTGIGFENEFKDAIFKVFTRLHNNNEYTGSGVGLALCKKIMQNHNGYIFAEGVAGEGARFSLFFPK